jgi:hypothetical protein
VDPCKLGPEVTTFEVMVISSFLVTAIKHNIVVLSDGGVLVHRQRTLLY